MELSHNKNRDIAEIHSSNRVALDHNISKVSLNSLLGRNAFLCCIIYSRWISNH